MIDFKNLKKIKTLISDFESDIEKCEEEFKKNPEDLYLLDLIKRTKNLISELKGMEEFYKIKRI